MEGYASGGLAASGDAGLAVLAGELAGLAGELAGAGAVRSFDEIEQQVMVRGRVLLRKVVQYVVDAQASAEWKLAGVADAGLRDDTTKRAALEIAGLNGNGDLPRRVDGTDQAAVTARYPRDDEPRPLEAHE